MVKNVRSLNFAGDNNYSRSGYVLYVYILKIAFEDVRGWGLISNLSGNATKKGNVVIFGKSAVILQKNVDVLKRKHTPNS